MGAAKSKIVGNAGSITLWKADRHPGCRAVMMALDALNLSVSEIDVDMDKYEHRSPKLLEMNPLGTLPILKDKDLILRDSHAITTYLASRYCVNSKMLPQDPGGRSLVDEALHYNSGVLYPRYIVMVCSVLYDNCKHIQPYQLIEVESSYCDLEKLLRTEFKPWFGGSRPTLADVTLAATVSSLNVLVPIDNTRYPLLKSWLSRMSEQPFYITGNKKGLMDLINCLEPSKAIYNQDHQPQPSPLVGNTSFCRRASMAALEDAILKDQTCETSLVPDVPKNPFDDKTKIIN